MSPIQRIYLDVDGVCLDIHQGLADFLGMPYRYLYEHMVKGRYDQPYLPEITEGNIWHWVGDNCPSTLWSSSPALDWFPAIWVMLRKVAPVFFLTSVASWPQAAKGRLEWFHKHFDSHFRDFVLTSHKHFLAKPGVVLVDDCDANLEAFHNAGGCTIRIPQRWNKGKEGRLTSKLKSEASYILSIVRRGIEDAEYNIENS